MPSGEYRWWTGWTGRLWPSPLALPRGKQGPARQCLTPEPPDCTALECDCTIGGNNTGRANNHQDVWEDLKSPCSCLEPSKGEEASRAERGELLTNARRTEKSEQLNRTCKKARQCPSPQPHHPSPFLRPACFTVGRRDGWSLSAQGRCPPAGKGSPAHCLIDLCGPVATAGVSQCPLLRDRPSQAGCVHTSHCLQCSFCSRDNKPSFLLCMPRLMTQLRMGLKLPPPGSRKLCSPVLLSQPHSSVYARLLSSVGSLCCTEFSRVHSWPHSWGVSG